MYIYVGLVITADQIIFIDLAHHEIYAAFIGPGHRIQVFSLPCRFKDIIAIQIFVRVLIIIPIKCLGPDVCGISAYKLNAEGYPKSIRGVAFLGH